MYFQNLKAMDSSGLSDPYVKLHLLPGACKVSLHFMRVCVCVCVGGGGGGGGGGGTTEWGRVFTLLV